MKSPTIQTFPNCIFLIKINTTGTEQSVAESFSCHHDIIFFIKFSIKVSDVTRKLAEEEEATMSISNALRKLESEVRRSKEDVENMDFR